jgi:hypothetical protein
MPRDRAPWTLAASVPQTDIDYGAWSSRRDDPQQRGGRWADHWTLSTGSSSDLGRAAVAGPAGRLRELDDYLQPASPLVRTWEQILDGLRSGCDEAEGRNWTVSADSTVARARQHAARVMASEWAGTHVGLGVAGLGRGAVRLGAGRFGLRQPSSVRLASLAQRSRGATTFGRMAARSGLAGKGENFSFRGCIRRPMGHPPGPTTCTAVRGAPPLRKKGCQFPADNKGKEFSLLATSNV